MNILPVTSFSVYYKNSQIKFDLYKIIQENIFKNKKPKICTFWGFKGFNKTLKPRFFSKQFPAMVDDGISSIKCLHFFSFSCIQYTTAVDVISIILLIFVQPSISFWNYLKVLLSILNFALGNL